MRELATHSEKLERYLGRDKVLEISRAMEHWYGPPVAVAGVPGRVFAHKGGDFRGRIATSGFASAACIAESFAGRMARAFRRTARKQMGQANAGFSSLSDLIAEASAGKKQDLAFQKVGTTGVAGVTNSLWRVGNVPAAGAAAAAAPGGIAPTKATTGALLFNNPTTGGDTHHFVGASILASLVNTLLMYDRIFAVAKTMNSTANESVTGVPTRYQSTTPNAMDSAEGNFLFVEVGSVLAATAHNWDTCLYTDQSGNAAAALPTITGSSGAIANRLDHPAQQWFAPLAAGDTGIQQLDQMHCSALVATGAIDFVIGHPIAFMPAYVANLACLIDGINTAFNLVRVFDDACLSFLEVTKPATGATTYSGSVAIVAG